MHSLWQRIRLLGPGGPARLDEPSDVEPALREGLFSTTQLESHARSLATAQELAPCVGAEMLLRRLAENEGIISRSYEEVAQAILGGHPQAPAAKWLVENYTFIEEQIDQVRAIFPPGYSRQLPRLNSGALRGYPRLYEVAIELVSHTDGRVDAENIAHFIRSYQTVHSLKLGELWAVPILVNLALVENLRRVSRRIAWRRRHRESAVEWSARFIHAVQLDPKSLITILADFVRSEPVMSAPFLAELTSCLQGTHPAMGLVINWVEQELAERGQTLELIQQAESHDQAMDHASISHSITSLRQLGRIDWRDLVESLSAAEATLRQDPWGVHPQMDFRSRDLCRREIEDLSRRSGQEEQDVAATALRLATERSRRAGTDPREATVGYFLVGDGRGELETDIHYRPALRRRVERYVLRHALPAYLLAITLFTAMLSFAVIYVIGFNVPPWWLAVTSVAVILVASRSAISIVNWWASLLVGPRALPRLDFSKGIPEAHRTAVIVPAMLSSAATIDKLIENLELRYLGNRSPNLLMVLLTDLPDALQEQMPEDRPLLDRALSRIRELNAKYAPAGATVFYLLHRPRLCNPRQRRWMGHERKRGKIEHFNRLVLTGAVEPFSLIEGDVAQLRSVRYGIVLDADTQLPPQAAWKMAAAMAHPLNHPHVDSTHQCVTRGYGILQPRLAVSLPQSQRSRYASLFAGDVGLDPYTREVSNVYMDLFGQGQFVGKAIYDIRAFDAAVSVRFPDNRILSHDLIEGCHARCGFLGDVELLEDHPERYLADASRRRRWARGDWQIARWLLPGVPGPDKTRRPNPLGLLARWMILDNLRRTLVPGALLAAFVLGWFANLGAALPWTAALMIMLLLPDVLRSMRTMTAKPRHLSWATYIPYAGSRELGGWAISLLDVLLTPFQAFIYIAEILRTQWRLVSNRHLLEWQTASDAGSNARTSLVSTCIGMWPSPVAATMIAALLAWRAGAGSMPTSGSILAVGLLLAAWFVSPAILWYLGRPASRRSAGIDDRQRLFLQKAARRTWEYFAQFVSAENHGLPPDNFQQDPPIGEAPRTSPTNMGMGLLGSLAAWDFGYVSGGTLLDRTRQAIQTMEELPRHRGHFLNWYDTRTLEPAPPRYVSTADSGNLCGSLVTLKAGLAELPDRPILPPRWRQGLEDAIGIVLEELDRPAQAESAPANVRAAMTQQLDSLGSAGESLAGIYKALSALALAAAQTETAVEPQSEVAHWLSAVRRQSEDLEMIWPGWRLG